jgi:hypothetical protein
MTHALYTRQSLQSLKLSELKAIANQIGATPSDRRSIESHIVAILERQPQPVVTDSCLAVEEQIEARATIANTANAILDELEIAFIDLSIGTDLIVPDGLDAYHAVYNGRVIIQVYNYKGGYVCRRGDGVVYDDPYSAMVNEYERYNPGAVLLARSCVDRDREIANMEFTDNEIAIFKGARDNDYADCFEDCGSGGFNYTWCFAVIDASGLDPKVARGAIASLVKKGAVEITDYEGKRRSDDMVFALTTEGVKAGNLMLMPEYA